MGTLPGRAYIDSWSDIGPDLQNRSELRGAGDDQCHQDRQCCSSGASTKSPTRQNTKIEYSIATVQGFRVLGFTGFRV